MRLDQRVAIVTGGAQGIGAAIVRRFAQEGAAVLVVDINGEQAETVAAELRAAGATWETIGEKYMASWSAGAAPDISLFSPANTTQAVRLGSLEDLQPAFKQWPEKDQKDLSQAWWETGTYDGKKYIAPLLLFGDMLLYRKSMFDKAGVNVAEIKSWDAVISGIGD